MRATIDRVANATRRERNDPGQYDDLATAWWDPDGPLAMLHWIAKARAQLLPAAPSDSAVLVDLGCGGGLFAPYVAARGYRHVGLDLNEHALRLAGEHGVAGIRADVAALPLADGFAEVVSAGEILEHVEDLRAVLAEACRVLRPGGLLLIDTIAATRLAHLLAIGVAERIPGGAPRGIHDPRLFVNRSLLRAECARHGIRLELSGLRPSIGDLLSWRLGRRPAARMLPTRFTSVLFQARGVKAR